MDAIVLGARLLLAAVLVVAGAAKLIDLAGSRRSLADFGVPAAFLRVGAVALPLLELAIGFALLAGPTARIGAVAAIVLLGVFTAGIAYQMARGRSPECHCFGALSSSRAGPQALLRNVALAGLGVPVALQGSGVVARGPIDWLADAGPALQVLFVGLLILGVALARVAWLLLQIVQQQGRLILRIEALEAAPSAADGQPTARRASQTPSARRAPPFRLAGLNDEVLTLDSLLARGRPVLLTFIDPGCGACDALIPELERWQRDAGGLTIAVVGRGGAEAMRAKIGAARLSDVLLQEHREVAEAYDETMTPAAILIERDATIRAMPARGVEAIRTLVNDRRGAGAAAGHVPSGPAVTSADRNEANGHAHHSVTQLVGRRAPPFELPDLAGGTVNLDDLAGDRTALLFWDPGCGFCQRMIDDVRAFETTPPVRAPKLVVVAAGSPEANAAQGFGSRVLLDPSRDVASLYGANGTPMAVIVDANGRIASPLAAGAPAVLALIRGG